MNAVLESPVERVEAPTAVKTPVVNKDAALIENAIKKIKWLQAGIGKATWETIVHLCGIGGELNDLHSQVEHGDWEAIVEEEVGLDKSTVQRLRKLADSKLREQIPTLGLDLQRRLTTDVQKLVVLTRVPDARFREFFERFDPSKMNRKVLRDAVNEFDPEGKDDTSRKGQSKSSKRRKSKATRSKGSPIKQLFAICEKPMADLVASIQTQLDRGKVDRTNMERAAAAITNARACLDALEMAIKEKLVA